MPGDFPTRPTKEVIREALHFVRDTGEPHQWRGHTHTRPPKGAVVEYLEEFDLPKARHKVKDLWAPCPICSPKAGKYFLSSKIAWFPDEGVIRMIGGDCYASLVGNEQHQAALAELHRRQRIERDEAFVVSQVPFVRANLPILDQALRYCRAVDAFRGRLLPRIGEALHSALWRHVSIGGELRVTQAVTDVRFVGGQTVERATEQDIRYAGLAGHQILRPPPNDPLAQPVERALAQIREIVADGSMLTAAASPEERSRAIRKLTRDWRLIVESLRQAQDLASFVTQPNIATLRTWAAHPNSPVSGYFALDGSDLRIGPDERETVAVSVPAELLTAAPALPPFGERIEAG